MKRNEQHNLISLVTYRSGVTQYRCVNCGDTGLDGIRGTCDGSIELEYSEVDR